MKDLAHTLLIEKTILLMDTIQEEGANAVDFLEADEPAQCACLIGFIIGLAASFENELKAEIGE